MVLARKPDSRLAAAVLPPPLYHALTHVFGQRLEDAMLVGGTGLAGYYAGHRRSDDIDLFTRDSAAQTASVLAVRSLAQLGTTFADERNSAQFFHATCELEGHGFTAQVVLDENLFEVGACIGAEDGVVVATVETLLKVKAATLVSRASEKDLYDLGWLFEEAEALDVPTLVAMGQQIDGGMNAEAVLINLVGTKPERSACGFSTSQSVDDVFRTVSRVRNALIQGMETYLRDQSPPPIAALLRRLE